MNTHAPPCRLSSRLVIFKQLYIRIPPYQVRQETSSVTTDQDVPNHTINHQYTVSCENQFLSLHSEKHLQSLRVLKYQLASTHNILDSERASDM